MSVFLFTVCPSLDIRGSPEQMQKLRGCQIIEGQLSIVLMEHSTPRNFENITFPELREVTDFIKIYRYVWSSSHKLDRNTQSSSVIFIFISMKANNVHFKRSVGALLDRAMSSA